MKPRPICLLLLLIFVRDARADFPTEKPYPGITFHSETRKDPAMKLFWVEIDLSDPHVSVRVSPGGPDPDGQGKFQTTLMPTSAIAQRERFDLAVNGDFFQAQKSNDGGFALPGYRANQWALVEGPAVTDGKIWSKSLRPHPCLVVRQGGKVGIEQVSVPEADVQQVISGMPMLVVKGKALKNENPARHPRTAVGVDEKGTKLVILVVDGRNPGVSEGMTLAELSEEFVRLGCFSAMNLDGGGSTSMIMREPKADSWKILNRPSDGKERPVANALGVRINRLPGEGGAANN
ncbi:MAG TPA: phosphodiester glycosidase family protein [Tepidisphaeraceae bacterium]|jgi:exopolysaccharide biosynthesis protein|nr:phosphodiester glycosidase family protein [Tepidisphaeraceae bacterium]